jgi:hypothetical protein
MNRKALSEVIGFLILLIVMLGVLIPFSYLLLSTPSVQEQAQQSAQGLTLAKQLEQNEVQNQMLIYLNSTNNYLVIAFTSPGGYYLDPALNITNLLYIYTGQSATVKQVNVGSQGGSQVNQGPVVYVDGQEYRAGYASGNVYGVYLPSQTPVIVLNIGQGQGPVLMTTSRGNEFLVNPNQFVAGEVIQLSQLSENTLAVRSSTPLLAFTFNTTPNVSAIYGNSEHPNSGSLNVTVVLENFKIIDFSNLSIKVLRYNYVMFVGINATTDNPDSQVLSTIGSSPLSFSVPAGGYNITNFSIKSSFNVNQPNDNPNDNYATVLLTIYFEIEYGNSYVTFYTYSISNTTPITYQ